MSFPKFLVVLLYLAVAFLIPFSMFMALSLDLKIESGVVFIFSSAAYFVLADKIKEWR